MPAHRAQHNSFFNLYMLQNPDHVKIETGSLERDAQKMLPVPSKWKPALSSRKEEPKYFTAATTFPSPFRLLCSQTLSLLPPTSTSQLHFLP